MSIYPPVRDEMIKLLSAPRLSTYTDACGGDMKIALELYQWNLEVSGTLFTSIHYSRSHYATPWTLSSPRRSAPRRHLGTTRTRSGSTVAPGGSSG